MLIFTVDEKEKLCLGGFGVHKLPRRVRYLIIDDIIKYLTFLHLTMTTASTDSQMDITLTKIIQAKPLSPSNEENLISEDLRSFNH